MCHGTGASTARRRARNPRSPAAPSKTHVYTRLSIARSCVQASHHHKKLGSLAEPMTLGAVEGRRGGGAHRQADLGLAVSIWTVLRKIPRNSNASRCTTGVHASRGCESSNCASSADCWRGDALALICPRTAATGARAGTLCMRRAAAPPSCAQPLQTHACAAA